MQHFIDAIITRLPFLMCTTFLESCASLILINILDTNDSEMDSKIVLWIKTPIKSTHGFLNCVVI